MGVAAPPVGSTAYLNPRLNDTPDSPLTNGCHRVILMYGANQNNKSLSYKKWNKSMKRDQQGHYITISTVVEKAKAFVPAPLPPTPPIEWSSELRDKFDQALLALGRLDSVTVLMPDSG